MKVKSESEVAQSCLTPSDPVDSAYKVPPSIGFSRQEYWSGLPLPFPPMSLTVCLFVCLFLKPGPFLGMFMHLVILRK